MELTQWLFEDVGRRHPRAARSLDEARAVSPERFDAHVDKMLGWARLARGAGGLEAVVDAYVQFSSDVNFAQARYEATGQYENTSYEAVHRSVYARREVMDDYLWGVFLTNALWPHHMELTLLYLDRFLPSIPAGGRILELAPGHGGWGISALERRPDLSLEGFDISPSSIVIARALSAAANVADRAVYTEQDALDPAGFPQRSYDAVVCCFLLEHLEDPSALVRAVAHALAPGGSGFLTGGLEAAQIDHIREFHHESELVRMCEEVGLRVRETLSVRPRRLLPKARFLPRSMALVVEHR